MFSADHGTFGGVSLDLVQSMGQSGEDDFEVLDSAFRASGQIDDERSAFYAHNSPGNHGMGCFPEAGCTHGLSHSRNRTVDHGERCFRSHISWGYPGPARGDNQDNPLFLCAPNQFLGNHIDFVRDNRLVRHPVAFPNQPIKQDLPGAIFPLPLCAFVADRYDRNSSIESILFFVRSIHFFFPLASTTRTGGFESRFQVA